MIINLYIGCMLCVISGVLELLKTLITTSSATGNYIMIALNYLVNIFKFTGAILIISFVYYATYFILRILDNFNKMQNKKEKQIS